MAVEVRWKDDPKRLPLLSRIFEWLEAKKPGLGRQIVLRENEVDNPNEWKARLINDNADIAAQFPGDTRLPHPMEWKSIRPDRERWGDEAKAVEEVYNRLGKNYRQAQRKRKIELDSVAAAAAADRLVIHLLVSLRHCIYHVNCLEHHSDCVLQNEGVRDLLNSIDICFRMVRPTLFYPFVVLDKKKSKSPPSRNLMAPSCRHKTLPRCLPVVLNVPKLLVPR